MEIYKLQQILVLTVCTVAGGICGLFYDIFRAYRRCTKPTPLKIAVCDILFWSISAVTVYLTIHLSNNAELRWYEPIGVIAGYTIYSLYLSRHCTPMLCRFIELLGKICRVFLNLVCIPQKFLHILILPIKKYNIRVKTRLLYIIRTSVEAICKKLPAHHTSETGAAEKLRILILKIKRK